MRLRCIFHIPKWTWPSGSHSILSYRAWLAQFPLCPGLSVHLRSSPFIIQTFWSPSLFFSLFSLCVPFCFLSLSYSPSPLQLSWPPSLVSVNSPTRAQLPNKPAFSREITFQMLPKPGKVEPPSQMTPVFPDHMGTTTSIPLFFFPVYIISLDCEYPSPATTYLGPGPSRLSLMTYSHNRVSPETG